MTNTWEDAPDMNSRIGLATSVIDRIIYAIGGSSSIMGAINLVPPVEVFDTGYLSVDQSTVNSKGKNPTIWGGKKK